MAEKTSAVGCRHDVAQQRLPGTCPYVYAQTLNQKNKNNVPHRCLPAGEGCQRKSREHGCKQYHPHSKPADYHALTADPVNMGAGKYPHNLGQEVNRKNRADSEF